MLTTHDMWDIEKVCSGMMFIDKGHIIYDGAMAGMRERFTPFDPALLRDIDMRAWQHARQVEDGRAPATINRTIAALRGSGSWLVTEGFVTGCPGM